MSKDLEQKSITYARNGILEYWVIDLVNKQLAVHTQPQNSSYLQVTNYKSGSVIPQAFPDLSLDLSQLLLF